MSVAFSPNRTPEFGRQLDPQDEAMLSPRAAEDVQRWLSRCPRHRPTALYELPRLARQLGIGRLYVKDESTRLGLGSFKALGGAYAVLRMCLGHVGEQLGRLVDPEEILDAEVRAISRSVTVACATDGNHGKSVAAGARFAGCRAVIFVHAGVAPSRVAAIEAFGAEVRRVDGTYDDAVAKSARVAGANGWTIVSDTSWPGYGHIPLLVAQGYTAMPWEVRQQIGVPPTHTFVQAGVGGLASAVLAYLSLADTASRLRSVIVEPARAACLYASNEAGGRVAIDGGEETAMAMLECYEPSLAGWRVVERLADAFMTVDEADAVRAATLLSQPHPGDTAIATSESGAAGLAGLLAAAVSPDMRRALGLTADSVVLLFNTEGPAALNAP